MKKFLLISILSVLVVGTISAQQLPLKEVIKQSARGLEETIPQGTAIAILNFKSPNLKFSEYVIETLIDELLDVGKLAIVDRSNLANIREEQKLSVSGDISDSSAIAIGKMLGARFIVTGSITDMKTHYQFRLRIVNVETATIQRQLTFELQIDQQVTTLLGIQRATVANIRDNWASVNLSLSGEMFIGYGFGFGARYERMLNANMSLGANVHITLVDEDGALDPSIKPPDDSFGIHVFFHSYPWGGSFFWGFGLGFYAGPLGYTKGFVTYRFSGLEIVPVEFGWKIDVGSEGGFYIQTGVFGALVIGKETYTLYGNDPEVKEYYEKECQDRDLIYPEYIRVYFGAGWAF